MINTRKGAGALSPRGFTCCVINKGAGALSEVAAGPPTQSRPAGTEPARGRRAVNMVCGFTPLSRRAPPARRLAPRGGRRQAGPAGGVGDLKGEEWGRGGRTGGAHAPGARGTDTWGGGGVPGGHLQPQCSLVGGGLGGPHGGGRRGEDTFDHYHRTWRGQTHLNPYLIISISIGPGGPRGGSRPAGTRAPPPPPAPPPPAGCRITRSESRPRSESYPHASARAHASIRCCLYGGVRLYGGLYGASIRCCPTSPPASWRWLHHAAS